MCDYYDYSHESSQEEYGNNDYLNEQLGVTSSGEGHLTNDGSDIKDIIPKLILGCYRKPESNE